MKHSFVGLCLLVFSLNCHSSWAKRALHPCEANDLTSQMICDNKELLQLDQKQQLQAQHLLRHMSIQHRALFMEQQNKWYTLRNECRHSLSCIRTMYQWRQQVLNQQAQYSVIRSSY